MVFEINDGSFLRLFEAFIETGPQLILQLYIFVEMQPLSPNIFTITGKKTFSCSLFLTSHIPGAKVLVMACLTALGTETSEACKHYLNFHVLALS